MHATTPAGDPAGNPQPNTRWVHGDVDRNGDLRDEFAELAVSLRLAAAITAATPELERDQLRAVCTLLRRRGAPA